MLLRSAAVISGSPDPSPRAGLNNTAGRGWGVRNQLISAIHKDMWQNDKIYINCPSPNLPNPLIGEVTVQRRRMHTYEARKLLLHAILILQNSISPACIAYEDSQNEMESSYLRGMRMRKCFVLRSGMPRSGISLRVFYQSVPKRQGRLVVEGLETGK